MSLKKTRLDELVAEADALDAAGYSARAIDRWRAAVEIERTPELLVSLGRALSQEGQRKEGVALLQEAVDAAPDYAYARFQLGFCYDDLRRFDDARRELEAGLALAQWGPAWAVLGGVYRALGMSAEEREAYERATSLDPTNAEAWYGLGLTYSGGEYQRARELFERAIHEDSENAAAHRELGQMLWRLGALQEAEKHFRTSLRHDDQDCWTHAYLGSLLMHVRQTPQTLEAESEFRKAIALNSGVALFHCDLGDALGRQGRWEEAERSYATALAMDVSNYLPNLRMAQMLIEKGRLTSARRYLERVLELKPNERRAREALERIDATGTKG